MGRPPPAPPGGATTATLARRRGDYGVDAPYVPLGLGAAGGLFLAAAGALARWRLDRRFWYGGPWAATSLVTATAPARVPGAP